MHRIRKWYLILLIAASLASYIKTLDFDFVYDDKVEILKSPYVQDPRYIFKAFTTSSWEWMYSDNKDKKNRSNYYRPVQTLSYLSINSLFGPTPKPFHVAKLILHVLCTILLFFICLELFNKDSSKSFLASLLFAVHPVHTEAVTWISGITDVTSTLFVLISFFTFVKYIKMESNHYIFISGISFFLGLLSKETAIMTIPLLLIYEYQHKKNLSLQRLKKYTIYLFFVAVYLLLRIKAIGSFVPVDKYQDITELQVIINAFSLLADYIIKLLLPIKMNAYYQFFPILSIFDIRFIISLAIISLVILILFIYRKSPTIFFSLSWIIITLLPVLHCKKVGLNVFTERYLYMPSVGFCILASEFLSFYTTKIRYKYQQTFIYIICMTVITSYYVQTNKRNMVWKNELSLWEKTAEDSPNSSFVRHNLGNAYKNLARWEDAIEQYKAALRIQPNLIDAHNNLGVVYSNLGRYQDEIREYKAVLALEPNDHNVHFNLAVVYGILGRHKEAIKEYKETLKLQSDDINSRFNLAATYGLLGLHKEAITEYKKAIKLNPEDAEAYSNMGSAYYRLGQYQYALKAWNTALFIDPANKKARENLNQTIRQ